MERKPGITALTPSSRLLRVALTAALIAAVLPNLRGQGIDIERTLKGVENRYNKAQTLDVMFSETYSLKGRKRVEKGELFLRKPGRMRWQYSEPPGKLFVSDGKFVYFSSPQENRAEKMKLNVTDDMRAPLAFLLGGLEFHKDFKEFQAKSIDDGLFVTAIPKSDKFPYSEVSFVTTPDFAIRRLYVKYQDNSTIEFDFDNEKRNPVLPETMFRFTPPPGAEYVDSSKQQ